MKKRIISFTIILVITIIVLYFSLKDDYTTIINTILNINKFWLLVAFFLLFGYYFFKSIVMYHFAHEFNKEYKYKDAIRLIIETNFFHAITPFASGGQPYEIYSLSKKNIKVTDATNISIECFVVYQIALVSLGLISIICNNIFHVLDSSLLKHLLTLGFMINLLVIIALLWITFSIKTPKLVAHFFVALLNKMKIVKNKEKALENVDKYLIEFNEGSKILYKNKLNFMVMIMLQFFSLISLYLIPLALFYGIGVYTINGFTSILVMSYVMLIGSFVPIPGGTGGLEYGFINFFKKFLPGSRLNAIMLLWRFITYYFGMILGAIVLNFKKDVKK